MTRDTRQVKYEYNIHISDMCRRLKRSNVANDARHVVKMPVNAMLEQKFEGADIV